MDFLTPSEIEEREREIRNAFRDLMATPGLVGRPDALQWQFLRQCLERLFDPRSSTGFSETPRRKLAQYKFEVQDRLRRYYLQSDELLEYLFTIVHRRDMASRGIEEPDDYPDLRGYGLLVRQLETPEDTLERGDLCDYMERFVKEAGEAEFEAYQRLPEVDMEPLEEMFVADGPAYRDILTQLERLSQKRWVVTEPEYNPSTWRLLSVEVVEIEETIAEVETTEYLYLRWWDQLRERYVQPRRETTDHIYILKRTDEGWCILDDIFPPPKTEALHRKQERC
jgi:hypothetical protein